MSRRSSKYLEVSLSATEGHGVPTNSQAIDIQGPHPRDIATTIPRSPSPYAEVPVGIRRVTSPFPISPRNVAGPFPTGFTSGDANGFPEEAGNLGRIQDVPSSSRAVDGSEPGSLSTPAQAHSPALVSSIYPRRLHQHQLGIDGMPPLPLSTAYPLQSMYSLHDNYPIQSGEPISTGPPARGAQSTHQPHQVLKPWRAWSAKDTASIHARRKYLRAFIKGLVCVVVALYAVFSIFWGALWKLPMQPLDGIIVDLDGGVIGLNVTIAIIALSNDYVRWSYVSVLEYPGGASDVAQAILDEQAWIAIVVNPGASETLNTALLTPDPNYNGSEAITVYVSEGRQESAYRNFIRPQTVLMLDNVTATFAFQLAQEISGDVNVPAILAASPQTIVQPIYYTINNMRPFHQPVATAATFVGLIYLLILSYFVVMIGYGARDDSGLDKTLRLKSLIKLRFISTFSAYFFVSLFYSLLNKVFHLETDMTFGHAGFLVLWMLNWVGMLSVGLALEALITILKPKWVPFFMFLWIILNNSVCMNPIEILPGIYRYGYAAPFYNISRAVRTIALGTKNDVPLNFSILFVWIILSCITMPLLQWYKRDRDIRYGRLGRKVERDSKGIFGDGGIAMEGVREDAGDEKEKLGFTRVRPGQ